MTTNDVWLTTHEAAEMLGLRPRTLYRFIDEGSLTAYRFGRVIRLKREDVVAFIDSCRIAPEPGSMTRETWSIDAMRK
jgi:excisionase family DNA binding protein